MLTVTVPATGQASAVFALERPERPLAIIVPTSLTASEVRVQFAQSSGGPFGDLFRRDGSGMPFVCYSGASGDAQPVVIVPASPLPWARVFCVASQTAARDFVVTPAFALA